MQQSEANSVLLCGRDFTEQELSVIQETVHMFPKLSFHELAQTLCENLSWIAPSGRYKVESCKQLLRKLERRGVIKIRTKRRSDGSGREHVVLSPQTDRPPETVSNLSDIQPIGLKPARSREAIQLWNEYIQRYHLLGYRRPFGAHQRYFIVSLAGLEAPLGCLLFAASAWAVAVRDEWIGWRKTDRSKRLYLIVNNTRFLLFPWVQVKNLASKALSLAAKRIRSDWASRYGYQPVLLETFVDPSLYQGTCYQAASWHLLGQTTGRGRASRHKHHYLSTPKLIYVYPLIKDFRAHLCIENSKEEVGR